MPVNLEKCMEKIPNRFALATVTAKRWEQLKQGARPMVEGPPPDSMAVVLREIETGKLSLDMQERKVEKHGIPIPPPPAPLEEPAAPEPEDNGEAA